MLEQMKLAINTTLNFDQIVLFHDSHILAQKSWLSSKEESDSFIQKIDEVLNFASKSKNDIEGIFVLSGPGNFTSLRVGIVIANAFAYALGVPIFSLNLFDFVKEAKGQEVVDLNHLQMEFPFAQMLLNLDFEKLNKKDIVEPEYFREAL